MRYKFHMYLFRFCTVNTQSFILELIRNEGETFWTSYLYLSNIYRLEDTVSDKNLL